MLSYNEIEQFATRELDLFEAGNHEHAKYSNFVQSDGKLVHKLILEWKCFEDSFYYNLCVYIIPKKMHITLSTFPNYYGGFETKTLKNIQQPDSEEKYFQLSLIEDLIFSYEFYKKFLSTFENIKNTQVV